MVQMVAIECSTATASVAISSGDRVVEHCFATDARLSEHVLVAIDRLATSSDLDLRATDAVAVSVGPGAFTGVRLAVAAAQGLALAWNVPVVPVSTLAVLAMGVDALPEHEAAHVLSAIDARMGEIYAGWFRLTRASVTPSGHESVLTAERLARPAGVDRYVAIGSGFDTYATSIAAAIGEPTAAFTEQSPRAANVAHLALRNWPSGAIPPGQVEAAYLRNKVALTTAERVGISGNASSSTKVPS